MDRIGIRAPRGALAGALGLCLALASCNIDDPFKGYRDSTVNLIAASGLAAQDLTTVGYQTTAAWTWAWRGATDADDANGGYEYMTLDPIGTVGAGAPEGLAADSPAYRLELVNLMPNGDFEEAIDTEWAVDAMQVTTAYGRVSNETLALNGNSLSIVVSGSDNVRFDLGTLKDAAWSSAHTYDWLSFVNDSATIHYSIDNFIDPDIAFATAVSDFVATSTFNLFKILLNTPMIGSEQRALVFGSSSPCSFILDDVRVIRSDIENRLRILLKPEDTVPSLVRGYYEFSIWARKPDDSHFLHGTGAREPYAAESLSLEMLQLSPEQSSAKHAYPLDGSADPEDGNVYDASAGWVRLRLRLEEGNNFVFDPRSSEAVLELSVYPYDYAQATPGAVEIAQPELRFYYNGY